jgi:LCP family protein required for cell wall assembly
VHFDQRRSRKEAPFAPYVRSLRRGMRKRRGLTAAALASAAILVGSGISYSAVDHYTGTIEPVAAFASLPSRPAGDKATNILLVGSADRGDMSVERRLELTLGLDDFGRHTDTMLLVHLTSKGAVDVVTLPRDSEVTIPEHTSANGQIVEAYQGKLNSAYSAGGPTLLVQAVEAATDVRVDHYVEVDFEGFVDIVNALGGVEVCTEEPIYDEFSGLDLPAGRTVVDGDMGLSYVRARYFDPMADYGRMQRQQAFLAAMARKAASLGVLLNPFKVSSTVDAVLGSLRADPSLDPGAVRGIMRQLRTTTPGDVTFHTVPVAGEEYLTDGGLAVQWDQAGSQALFAALRENAPVIDDTDVADLLPHPRDVPLSVLNGNGTAGLATQTANEFAAAGFPMMIVGDADPTENSVIAFPDGAREQAESVARYLPEAELVQDDQVTNVTVTLGSAFESLTPVELPDEMAVPTGLADMRGNGGICS